ncbi:MAG: glycerophosphodiester phosphodiesterase [Elioraea sp.]|nr:glycerophosphodiester phosphodiesterase [Elioraea sp.]MDW8445430.1 glycerophosphodiester phosphodiesterase [Acetobacteraceae bacterium]
MRPVDLQGHRGARGLAPENTLAGFARALAVGVTTLEMDIAVTADGAVVVSHDPVLNPDLTRGPDGAWLEGPGPAIRSLTLNELRRYDVGRLKPGSRTAALFPDQLPADGERIPTLAEVIALTRAVGADQVRFNIETKVFPDRPHLTVPPEEMAERLVAVLLAEGVASRAMVQSFDWRSLLWVQGRHPTIVTSYLTSARTLAPRGNTPSPWLAGFDPRAHGGSIPRLVRAAGGSVWSPDYRDLTAEAVDAAHDLGLAVIPWTVNEAAEMERLLAWGVDGLITDYPDRGRMVLRRKGIRLPPAIGSAG